MLMNPEEVQINLPAQKRECIDVNGDTRAKPAVWKVCRIARADHAPSGAEAGVLGLQDEASTECGCRSRRHTKKHTQIFSFTFGIPRQKAYTKIW